MNSKTLAHDRLKRMCGSSSFTKTKVRHHAKARAEAHSNPTFSHHESASTPSNPPAKQEVNVRDELVRQVDAIIASEAHVIESALQLCQKIDMAIGSGPALYS